jgi:hypothetical protein
MTKDEIKVFIKRILSEIRLSNGQAATDRFTGLRDVDSKIREVKIAFESVESIPKSLIENMNRDQDFEAQSRRVRLEALGNYCDNAIRLMDSSAIKDVKVITRIPDIKKLVSILPDLERTLSERWLDAQKCVHQKCYLAAIILMGSVLEGLLLARVSLSPSDAYKSSAVPKDKGDKPKGYTDWNLSELINVAVDIGWIKSDRGKFSHALRESRNIVHPWAEITSKAYFDEYTCSTSWEALKASISDLRNSV